MCFQDSDPFLGGERSFLSAIFSMCFFIISFLRFINVLSEFLTYLSGFACIFRSADGTDCKGQAKRYAVRAALAGRTSQATMHICKPGR